MTLSSAGAGALQKRPEFQHDIAGMPRQSLLRALGGPTRAWAAAANDIEQHHG